VKAYICKVCGYLYDEQTAEKDAAKKAIPFEELAPEWVCPVCGIGPDLFEETFSNRPQDVPVK
jgi:rubredoxin